MGMDRIAYVKDKYNVLEYARDILGFPVHKSGDRCVSFAPDSHNNTAMVIYNDSWYDFKQGIGGDVIDLCAYVKHNGDIGEAIKELAGDYGCDPEWKERALERDSQIEEWHRQLRESDWKYLYRRNIKKSTVDRLKIGYNEKEQRLIIPYWKNGHVAYWVGRDRSGASEASKYKKAYLDGYNENIAWGLWTFDEKHRVEVRQRLEKNFDIDPPKIDTQGMSFDMPPVSKTGGSVSENEGDSQKKIISLADRQKMLDDIGVVAEGAFDALSFEQEGFKVLSPISGYFNKEAKKQVINLLKTVKHVFVCFDNDKAGTRFTLDMCKTLFKHRINFVCGVLPPDIKDVSDYYAAGGDLFELVANAVHGIITLAERITDKDEFKDFLFQAARFVDDTDLIELCENITNFSAIWVKAVLKKALKMPPEKDIIDELLDQHSLKYVEGIGFYEYGHGVWIKRSDNMIGGYLSDILGIWGNGNKLSSLMKTLKAKITTEEIFNRKPIFNFRNGVLELETGVFREHRQGDSSSIQASYNYDPKAACFKWEKFIREIMMERELSIKLLQEMSGYILFSDCKLQKAFFLIGEGANGKSVFLNLIQAVFGKDNVSRVEMSSLVEAFQRIGLINSLVNISTETNSDVKGAESIFKQIVVGDPINGCHKSKDFVIFNPRCVMISACNEYIKSRDTTFGFLRRIIFIDFPRQFEGENADLHLEETLMQELPGIFNWIYEGYKRLKAQMKFTETPEQADIMEDFVVLTDQVADFIQDSLLDADGIIERSELYRKYLSWTKETMNKPQSRTRFIRNFRKVIKRFMPYVTEGKSGGMRFFSFKRDFPPASEILEDNE